MPKLDVLTSSCDAAKHSGVYDFEKLGQQSAKDVVKLVTAKEPYTWQV
jgi:hypothetical protein